METGDIRELKRFSTERKRLMVHLMNLMMASKNVFRYFAYGSNLLKERILIHNPSAKLICHGYLHNFRLCFGTPAINGQKSSHYWLGAIANIKEASPNDCVIGLVWEISLDDRNNLDSQEMNYKALTVPINLSDGRTEMCRTYQIESDVTGECLPDPYYKKIIVSGAKQNGLPEDYIQFLESFEDTKDSTVPQGYQDVMTLIDQHCGKSDLD